MKQTNWKTTGVGGGELSPMREEEGEEEGEEEPRGGQRLSNCYLLPHLLPITIQERPRTQTRT